MLFNPGLILAQTAFEAIDEVLRAGIIPKILPETALGQEIGVEKLLIEKLDRMAQNGFAQVQRLADQGMASMGDHIAARG